MTDTMLDESPRTLPSPPAERSRCRQRRPLLAACAAAAVLLAPHAWASHGGHESRPKDDFAAADDPADGLPAASISDLRLDFDSRPGATVIGITGSAALTNHTIYEPDDTTTVVEIADADATQVSSVAKVGTAEVPRILVENVSPPGTTPRAQFTIVRAKGTRRAAALDPKNPKRLEITITGDSGTPSSQDATPAPTETKVLASAPAAPMTAPAAPTQAAASAPAPVRKAAVSPPRAAVPPAPPARHEAAPAPQPSPAVEPEEAAAPAVAPMAAAASVPVPSASDMADDPGPGRLTAVAIDKTPDGRMVVRLSGSKPLQVTPFPLDNPPRLALDVNGVVNAVDRTAFPVRQGGVQRVRIAQNRPLPDPVVRIVLDMDDSQPFQVVTGPTSTAVVLGQGGTVAAAEAGVTAPAWAGPGSGAVLSGGPTDDLGRPGKVQVASQQPLVRLPDPQPVVLGNLGRPSTFDGGTAPGALTPAGTSALRETAGSTGALTKTPSTAANGATFQTVKFSQEEQTFTGAPMDLHYKDADLQDVFRAFKVISGFNIIVDPDIRGKTITLDLTDVPWDQALALVLKVEGLGSRLDGNVLTIAPLNKLAQAEQQKQQLRDAMELGMDLTSISKTLSYASASVAQGIIRKSLSSRGDVQIDPRTNTLIIKDIKPRVEEIDRLLTLLDRPTPQVMIEARIVETTKNYEKAFGVNWGFTYLADRAFGNQTNYSFPRAFSSDYAVNLPATAFSSQLGLSFRNILNTFALDLAIQQLESRNRARIISSPRVMVQNNQQAQIESGVQIPIATTTATEISVQFISASLKLTVTPQITADGVVIMNVQVDDNQPLALATGQTVPISTRQARTVVAVPDGGTTVIGGIYTVNQGATTSRVPFLSRIPLLGWLFRNKDVKQTNDELLIFLTPHIQKA